MNYTITINQYAGEIHFPELDIIDLAIFDYISRFYASADKFNDISGTWIWISHKKIIQDMPKLKINSKAGIIRRINNLVEHEILERHPESQQLSKSYYRIGRNWDLLTKIDTYQSKSTGAINENQEPPLDENQDYPNTIHPNTIYSKFYNEQIEISGCDFKYMLYVGFIYGTNLLEKKYARVLAMKDQLTFDQFNKLQEKISFLNKHERSKEKPDVKLSEMLTSYENGDYKHNSVYLTMNNWINREAGRRGIQ